MAVTKLKPGIYRHVATGFIVHDVFSVDQVIAANGVLFETSTSWVWLAGRDLRDLLARYQPQTLVDLLVCAQRAAYQTSMLVRTPHAYNKPRLCLRGAIGDVLTAKVFALVTNLDCGYGSNAVDALASRTLQSGAYAFTGNSTGNGYYGTSSKTLLAGAVGVGCIRVPLGYNWSKFADNYFAAQPNNEESEVKARYVGAKARFEKWLQKQGLSLNAPVAFGIPIILMSDGRHRYIPPMRAESSSREATPQVNATDFEVGSVPINYIYHQRLLGSRAYVEDGSVGQMVLPLAPAALHGFLTSAGGNHSGTVTCGDEFSVCPRIGALDGVPLTNILGGAAGFSVDDLGKYTDRGDSNLSTKYVFDYYRDILSFPITTTVTDRVIDSGTGTYETDAVMQQRLTTLWDSTEYVSAAGIHLTQYDSLMLTPGQALVALGLAFMEGKNRMMDYIHLDESLSIPLGVPAGGASANIDGIKVAPYPLAWLEPYVI